MTFVALSIADWPTGAAANDLLSALLAVAPRAAVDRPAQLAWLDGRSLDAAALSARAREHLATIGVIDVSAGASNIPAVAAIAAREKRQEKRDPLLFIANGCEREWLAPLSLDVLLPTPRLLALLTGVGVTTCRDLAALTRESIEVRFGREAVALWRLARADDPRPIFSSRPREHPGASLDWAEFSTTDLEQLVFVLHSLLRTVCDALMADGVGARTLRFTLAIENRTVITQSVTAARSTSQRTTWLRLMRRALERITLPDRVTGIAIEVDAVGPPSVRQGDLFDLGFASAEAAESAVAHVMDLQSDAVVRAERREHVLREERIEWSVVHDTVIAREPGVEPGTPALHPQLLPRPRAIDVVSEPVRGFAHPVRYTDNGVKLALRECIGPHCVSGNRWSERFTREYHQGVRDDGVVVLLYRDVVQDQWWLAGWWD